MAKKLYRSTSDRLLLGVCGGLAAYFGLDSTLVRLAAAVLVVLTFPLGLVLYVVFALVMPPEPWQGISGSASGPAAEFHETAGESMAATVPDSPEDDVSGYAGPSEG